MVEYIFVGNNYKINKSTIFIGNSLFPLVENTPDNFIEIKGYATFNNYYSIRQFGFQIVATEVEAFDIELYDGSTYTIFAKDEDEVEKIKDENNIY